MDISRLQAIPQPTLQKQTPNQIDQKYISKRVLVKISHRERCEILIEALFFTIITLGFGLLSIKLRNKWKEVYSGHKYAIVVDKASTKITHVIDKTLTPDSKVIDKKPKDEKKPTQTQTISVTDTKKPLIDPSKNPTTTSSTAEPLPGKPIPFTPAKPEPGKTVASKFTRTILKPPVATPLKRTAKKSPPKPPPIVPTDNNKKADNSKGQATIQGIEIDGPTLKFDLNDKSNFEKVKSGVMQNGLTIQFASKELQENVDIALLALNQNLEAVKLLPRTVLKEKVIYSKVLKEDSSYLWLFKDIFIDDEELAQSILDVDPFRILLLHQWRDNESFILKNLDKDISQFLFYTKNENIAIAVLNKHHSPNSSAFLFLTQMHNNKKVALIALNKNPDDYYILKDLKNDPDILQAVSHKIDIKAPLYKFAPIPIINLNTAKMLENLEVFKPTPLDNSLSTIVEMTEELDVYTDEELANALDAVKQDGLSLEGLDIRFKRSLKVVSAAIESNPNAIQFATLSFLLKRKDLIKKVLTQDYNIYTSLPHEVKIDEDVALDLLEINDNAFSSLPEELLNKPFILKAVARKGMVLFYINQMMVALSEDEDVVLAALGNEPDALCYAGDIIKKNKEFIKKAMALCGLAVKDIPDDLKKDFDVALAAVMQNGLALQYLLEFQTNKIIVQAAIKNNKGAHVYASPELLKDPEILALCHH